jgi:protein SCO1/2
MMASFRALMLLALCTGIAGCGTPPRPVNVREFPLTGEILSIKPDKSEVRIKHDDVKGFMEAMTMWFNIKEPRLLDGLAPGDLVKATLVVTDEESYLSSLQKTGSRPAGEPPPATPPPEEGLRTGDLVPGITLTDESGQALSLSAYRGAFTLITFIYTRCPLPDYCPRMNAYFGAIQRAVKAQPALGRHVRLLSISFDPDYDTPARLKAKAREAGADPALWHFVTGPRERVDAFGATFGLSVLREGPKGQDITHNLRTALIDRDGKLVKTYNGNDWSPDQVVGDLQALVK